MGLRLNVGSGPTPIDGFVNVDRAFGQEAFPLAFKDGEADELRASHILEHFSWGEVPLVLNDWVRVLRPGGVMRLSVPDFDKLRNGEFEDDPLRLKYVMGGQIDANDYHKSLFDTKSLTKYMRDAGLEDIKPFESELFDTSCHKCSLNLEGRKPLIEAVEKKKVIAVMSVPRTGWTDSFLCILRTVSKMQIPLRQMGGVFWGQCLQNAFETAVDDYEYILTIDFDSMFTEQHLSRLISVFDEHPEMDALAAWQRRRFSHEVLVQIKGRGKIVIPDDAVKVDTAHFGLTLLRTEKLRELPKPWFLPHPDAHGGWGDGKIDDDIHFWHIWRKAGYTCFVDPHCRIGHLEMVVSGYNSAFQPIQQYPKDWWSQQTGEQVMVK